MYEGYDNSLQVDDIQLQVWGDVGAPVERLLSALSAYGWQPQLCGWPEAALDKAQAGAQLMVLDGGAQPHLERLQSLLNHDGAAWVVVAAPQEMQHMGVRSTLAQCAYACLCLPGDVAEVDALLRSAQSMVELRTSACSVDAVEQASNDSDEVEMVGSGSAMLGLFKSIRKVATADATVLIRGESGTGKELAARAIHERSGRCSGPFVAVNCGALPPELVQSELFGYEKGAFTGASRQHIGHVEAASGGTLLLDEIGDLPLPLQVHLLRFLQSGRIQRVGGSTELAVDVRVLAATHVPLEQAVADGHFREDLYHRLNVVSLTTPPLRERPEDIELLARFFFKRFVTEHANTRLRGISEAAMRCMCQHVWPGNVRELINRMRRAVLMSEGRLIGCVDLGLEDSPAAHQTLTLDEARQRAECRQVKAALRHNRHHITAAARELGVSRVTLYRLIDKHQLG